MYPAKFCDQIENISVVSKNTELPTIYSFFTTKVIHLFNCNVDSTNYVDAYLRTEVYYKNSTKPIVLKLFSDTIFSDYSKSSHKYLYCLKSFLIQQLDSGIEYSADVPVIMSYGKKHINVYISCGVEYVKDKKNKNKNNRNNRSFKKNIVPKQEISHPLFSNSKLYDIIGYDLTPNESKLNRHNCYKLMKTMTDRIDNIDGFVIDDVSKIKVVQKIVRPIRYVNNVDSNIEFDNNFDCNTFYIYMSVTKLKEQIERLLNDTTIKQKARLDKIYDLLINYAIGLFYINVSNSVVRFEDFNHKNVFFLILFLLRNWYFDENITFSLERGDLNTLYRRTKSKFENLFSKGIFHYLNNILGIINAGSLNQCCFPCGWSKEEKDDWKSDNGIVRKVRQKETKPRKNSVVDTISTTDLRKILRYHRNGKSLREIEKLMNIGKDTIKRIIDKNKK